MCRITASALCSAWLVRELKFSDHSQEGKEKQAKPAETPIGTGTLETPASSTRADTETKTRSGQTEQKRG